MGHLGDHFLLKQLPLHLLRTVAEDEQAVALPDILLRALDDSHVQGEIHFALVMVKGEVALNRAMLPRMPEDGIHLLLELAGVILREAPHGPEQLLHGVHAEGAFAEEQIQLAVGVQNGAVFVAEHHGLPGCLQDAGKLPVQVHGHQLEGIGKRLDFHKGAVRPLGAEAGPHGAGQPAG
ncbi:hypothetical protein D3C75_868510 [compost metagenome]